MRGWTDASSRDFENLQSLTIERHYVATGHHRAAKSRRVRNLSLIQRKNQAQQTNVFHLYSELIEEIIEEKFCAIQQALVNFLVGCVGVKSGNDWSRFILPPPLPLLLPDGRPLKTNHQNDSNVTLQRENGYVICKSVLSR